MGFDRAALFMTTESGVLVPMAYLGADRLDWLPDQAEPSPWSRAWRSGRPEQATGTFAGSGVAPYPERRLLVVPMLLGERRVGLVGAERDEGGWSRSEVHTATRLLSDAAGALDTGALFSEVRALATMEERRRLAREIHDGVAQEVAALGFAVDDLRARVDDPDIAAALRRPARRAQPGGPGAAAVDLRPALATSSRRPGWARPSPRTCGRSAPGRA